MAGEVEANKVYKHPQREKLMKETEEDSWISGEELRTEGSSDEETSKGKTGSAPRNKLKTRKKSKESEPSGHKPKDKNVHREAEAAGTSNSPEPSAPDTRNKWRPKRGSLTLPNLHDDAHADEESIDEEKLEAEIDFFVEMADKINCLRYVSPEDLGSTNESGRRFYGDAKVKEMFMKIKELERRIDDEANLLQVEKNERLKTQEEMCLEMYKEEGCFSMNSETFLDLCHFEDTAGHFEESDEENEKCDKPKPITTEKNFIRRNIELASKAMSALPLTDEEKRKLESLLTETDLMGGDKSDDSQRPDDDDEGELDLEGNAYQVSDDDQRRMGEIDSKLENFTETQSLKLQDAEIEDGGFWKSLILHQALKDVDRKLADIRKSEGDEDVENLSDGD